MKLKNIISIICLIFVFVSCSSEDDILNDMGKGQNLELVQGEKMAYVSFNIDGIQTRAGLSETDIKSAVCFLLDGDDKIIGYADKDGKILTKVKTGLKVVAVANASEATIANLKKQSTWADLKKVELGKDDLDGMIKINKEPTAFDFTIEGVPDTPGKYEGDYPTEKVTVRVDQVTSCVEFCSFETVYAEGVSDEFKTRVKNITLESCRLVNANKNGLLEGVAKYIGLNYELSSMNSAQLAIGSGETVSPGKAFLAFANNETYLNATALEVTYQVDSKEKKTSVFKIKKNGINEPYGVEAGKKYQLRVKVTVKQDDVELFVSCSVLPWIERNIDLGEIESTTK
ncbi:hypothetical protein [Parabacteroides provencensis]|uniref:hypothetical protein n=1 Tax=Parabacteroides provencensis TaxID=1944636 RepID=UPI00118110E7|nr:hypothetical protein [Parabacteroides provencensis]